MKTRSRIVISLASIVVPLLAFKANIHIDITNAALNSMSVTVDGQPLQFTAQAIQEIADANENVDCGGNVACACYTCQVDSSRHFDNEAFEDSTERLIRAREAIIAALTRRTPKDTAARRVLGAALHTVQDYYAHSNWTNLNGAAVDSRLGLAQFSGLPITTETCPSEPGTLGAAGLTSITSGWFDIPNVCFYPPGKCSHGGLLGCMSTGISKDEPGRVGFPDAETAAIAASQAFVNGIVNYAGGALPSGRSYPAIAGNSEAIRALLGLNAAPVGLSSAMRFEKFEFVRLAGRPGHESYFAIPGQPIVGEAAMASAVLSGPVASATFRMVSESGADLGALTLRKGDRNAAKNEYVGPVLLPQQPFRIAVKGVDTQGKAFERIFAAVYTAREAEVAVTNTTDAVSAGARTGLTYRVRNAGTGGSFHISVGNDRGFAMSVNPASVLLAPGSSADVTVHIAVPAGALQEGDVQVTVSAARSGRESLGNGTVQRLEIAPAVGR